MNVTVINALPVLPIERKVARLSTFDGSVFFEFLINPERMQYTLASNFASLPVLNTSQPLVKYQYSETGLSLPEVKLWTPANNRDLSGPLDLLKSWTRPDPTQSVPKLLKFAWGQAVWPRVYLSQFDYEVTQWRSGAPTQAEGSMVFLIAPEVPEAVTEQVQEITAREAEKYTTLLQAKFPGKAIAVSAAGRVTADGEDLGTLSALLGAAALPAGTP